MRLEPLVVHAYKDQRWVDPWWYDAQTSSSTRLNPDGHREQDPPEGNHVPLRDQHVHGGVLRQDVLHRDPDP